jgi:hypothetical protein
LDLLGGEEPYKLRWTSEVVSNHRVIVGKTPIFWGPYVAYRLARSKASRYVEEESTPRWIKSALNRFRGRRSTINPDSVKRQEESGGQ